MSSSISHPGQRLSLQFTYRFEAAHRLTSSASPSCRTPHGHTWYATASFEQTNTDLDNADMLAEFSRIKQDWKSFIHETVDHSYFHHHGDALIERLLQDTPEARLLPFPGDPTTEMIAGLFAAKLITLHQNRNRDLPVRVAAIKIRETPTNTVVLRLPADGSLPSFLKSKVQTYTGWWSDTDIRSRRLSPR